MTLFWVLIGVWGAGVAFCWLAMWGVSRTVSDLKLNFRRKAWWKAAIPGLLWPIGFLRITYREAVRAELKAKHSETKRCPVHQACSMCSGCVESDGRGLYAKEKLEECPQCGDTFEAGERWLRRLH